jgi:hypothetical protein
VHSPIATLREIGASDAAPAARHILHRDYETRGTISLKAAGTYKYAAHAGTSIICCTYALDDQPVALWLPGDPVPPEFVEADHNPSWDLVAHGAHFEIAIERHILWAAVRLSGDSIRTANLHAGDVAVARPAGTAGSDR